LRKLKKRKGLLFRGNVATGFKAPTLRQIYRGKSVAQENVRDAILYGQGPDVPLTTEVDIETQGNKNLKQETLLSYNLGVVTDPIEGLSIGADYWYIRINDIIQNMESQKVIDAVAAGQSFEGVVITRVNDDPNGRLRSISIPTLNLGKSEDAGIDTNAEYRFRAGGTRMAVGSEYSRKFYSKQVSFPGQPQEDILGQRGKPRWRLVNNGSVAFGNQSVLLRNNIVGKQTSRLDPELEIGSFTTYDLQYSWNHPWNGSVAIGALNILNTDFPRDNSERSGDDTRVKELYSADGRVLYVNLNQVF
jgi:iron complex outermembrane receptor protein